MKEQVKVCIQGGIAKDRAELGIVKVQAIYIIPMLKDSKSRQKKNEEKEIKSRKKFSSFLQQAYGKIPEQNIICHTNGYTKNAINIEYNYESKEYKA